MYKHYFILGIGNKGQKYHLTRHNVGFMVIDYLIQKYTSISCKEKFDATIQQINYQDKTLSLIKPQTYVNLSGEVINEIKKYYRLENKQIIVIVDDYYLPFGTIRIRPSGGDGGHNGLKSIQHYLGKDYLRIRGGIYSQSYLSLEQFVLSKFSSSEQRKLPSFITHLSESVLMTIDQSPKEAMNKYHSSTWLD